MRTLVRTMENGMFVPSANCLLVILVTPEWYNGRFYFQRGKTEACYVMRFIFFLGVC